MSCVSEAIEGPCHTCTWFSGSQCFLRANVEFLLNESFSRHRMKILILILARHSGGRTTYALDRPEVLRGQYII